MKFLSKILTATLVASPLFIAGCFNTGETNAVVNVVDRFSLKIEVLDAASGEPVPGATVEIVDDPLDVITSFSKSTGPIIGTTGADGIAEFELDDSQVVDENNDGQPDDIPNVRVRITKTGAGGLDEAEIVSSIGGLELQSVGSNSTVIAVTSIAEPPAGVSVSQTSFDPFARLDEETGELAVDCEVDAEEGCTGSVDVDGDGEVDEFVFAAKADSDSSDENHSSAEVELALPRDAVLTTADGEELNIEDGLMVVVTAYDAAEPEALNVFPGGFSAQVSNVGDLADDLEVEDLDGNGDMDDQIGDGDISETVAMQSAGFAAVEIRDIRGRIAANVSGEDRDGLPLSARVRINVSPDAINPETEEAVKAGDKIPVWSLNESSGEWQYESIREVIQGADGGLYTEFETDHFSYFNMDWFRRGEDGRSCSPTFYLRDEQGNDLDVRASITISGESRNGAGYSKRDYYRGEGYLTFHNSPTVPLTLNFDADERGRGFELVDLVGVAGNISADKQGIEDIRICNSAGGVVVARIVDIVEPPFITAVRQNTVTEGEEALVTLRLDGTSETDVTLTLQTIDGDATAGSDYTAVAGQVITIPAGQTSAEVRLATIDDTDQERTERFSYQFSNLSGAQANAYFTNANQVYIRDNDLPTLSVTDVTVSEADGVATVTVALDKLPINNISGYIYARNGTAIGNKDFSYASQRLFFSPTSPISTTFEVEIINDGSTEDTETFEVFAYAYSNQVTNLNGRASGTVSIEDDGDVSTNDPAALAVSIEVDSEVQEGRYYRYLPTTVALNQAFDRSLTVTLNTADGTATGADNDFRTTSRQLTFPAGETRLQVFGIYVIGDSRQEDDETFSLALSDARVDNVANSDVVLADAQQITILDDDSFYVYGGFRYANEAQGATLLDVRISRTVEEDVPYTVEIQSANYQPAIAGEDFTVDSSLLSGVIPAGQNGVSIPVTIIDDNDAEPTEYMFATFDVGGQSRTAWGTILDNDRVRVAIGDAEVTEGGTLAFQVNLAGGTRVGPFTLSVTTVDDSAQAPSDYTVVNSTVTVNPSDDSVVIEVPTSNNAVVDGERQLFVNISVASATFRVDVTDGVGIGTILDNDSAQQTGTGGGSDGSQTGGGGDGI